ncbi:MAG: dihydropteroate synthase [Sedimentisphaeraceae bacterium JB056]
MQKIHDSNDQTSLALIQELITTQADCGADFIEVNVDKFGELGWDVAAEMMKKYVAMVAEFGKGVPACIDSSNNELLEAGLESWYAAGAEAKPLINSIKPDNADRLFSLKDKYPFVFIGLLMSHASENPVQDLVDQAELIFDKAAAAGFAANDIYYDTGAFPLSIDMPMMPGEKGRTFTAFETIKALKDNPKFAGVHFSLGISNCAKDLPGRRIGVIKAYIQKAMEYGLDAGIIDVRRDWFQPAPAEELVELVTAFAEIDGSSEKQMDAMSRMSQFCQDCRDAKGAK